MDLGLTGRCFLIGGGGRGLGLATAAALHAEGAAVVLVGRTPATVHRAADTLGPGAYAVPADLGEPAAAARVVADALALTGRLDGALINVGGPRPGGVLDYTDDDWQQAFAAAFLAPLRLARAVIANLTPGVGQRTGDTGALLFVLSGSVRSPIAGLTGSNGLRPGLAMLVKELADELGPVGVRVNAVLPARVATDRVAELDAVGGDAERTRRAHEEEIPLRRYGRPEELGRVAAFLLSPAASYVTGGAVAVDGGALRAV